MKKHPKATNKFEHAEYFTESIAESFGKWAFTILLAISWTGSLLSMVIDFTPLGVLGLIGNALFSGFVWWRFWSDLY